MSQGIEPGPGRRKTVCRALASTMAESHLSDVFDPKAFYMLLSTNFAVLDRGEAIDLAPLWGSLSQQLGSEDRRLAGVFLGLEQALAQLDLRTILPGPVGGLDEAARHEALRAAFPVSSDEAVVQAVPAEDLLFDTGEMPELSVEDLRPVVSDDLKREVTNIVVQCLKGTEMGPRLDGAQLAYLVDDRFMSLCDGQTFDLGPILEGLDDLNPQNESLYVGLVRMHRRLSALNIELRAPDLGIDPETGAQLVAAADAAEKADRRKALGAQPTRERPADPPPETTTTELPKGENKKERELRRYGLLGISSKRWRNIRLTVFTLLIVVLGAGGWIFRPSRPLDPKSFPLPLQAAKLKEGIFVGVLDETRWYKMTKKLREQSVVKMQTSLQNQGISSYASIVDSKKRVVIRGRRAGQLQASRFALESPDGVMQPPPGKPRDPAEVARELKKSPN